MLPPVKQCLQVSAVVQGDKALSARLSGETVTVNKTNGTPVTLPAEVVALTAVLLSSGDDLNRNSILLAAHEHMVINPGSLPKPEHMAAGQPPAPVSRRPRAPEKPATKAGDNAPVKAPAKTPAKTPVKVTPPTAAAALPAANNAKEIRPGVPVIVGVAICNLLSGCQTLLAPHKHDPELRTISDEVTRLIDRVYALNKMPNGKN